ncbi:hypothetical protein [Streptomyces violaceus]|uniref:Integral membrane protein n=1 Tax=Streptomyces violaceus TaxID=1936 RepID=A0ABZ1NLW8_STRVL
MSERAANQGLFRFYALGYLITGIFVMVIAFEVSDLPDLGIAIYLGFGVVLWVVNMVLTSGQPRGGHGLSHAVLSAAFALVWPLVIVALIYYLSLGVIEGLRR